MGWGLSSTSGENRRSTWPEREEGVRSDPNGGDFPEKERRKEGGTSLKRQGGERSEGPKKAGVKPQKAVCTGGWARANA